MITQKERKLLIMMLILSILVCLIFAISIISLVSQAEKSKGETTETTIESIQKPEETEPANETHPAIETAPTIEIQSVTETEPETEIKSVIEVKTLENISTEPVVEEGTEFQDRCRLVYAESRGEIEEGQIAVAATIINREEHENFPDDFYGVMNQSGQFSPVWNGEIHVSRGTYSSVLKYEQVSEQTIEAVRKAINGEDPTEQLLWDEAVRLGLDPEKYAKGGAVFFYNPAGCDWQQQAARSRVKVKVQIGNHIFYKVWDT